MTKTINTMNRVKQIGIYVFIMLVFGLTGAYDVQAQETEKAAGFSAQLKSGESIDSDDIRVEKLEAYLTKLNSPLVENAEDFVDYADAYEFGENWAIVAAIAGVESTFGKHVPKNSYNAWGWGIPTGSQSGIGFSDWEDGIGIVSQGLKEKYMDNGATNLASIGKIYAPPSTTWAHNVEFFMNQIESTSIEPTLTL